eukprot:m.244855 g.244855  ORF g.244855 m.244855 type:complete len:85 (+) comp15356_c0_seq36:2063-2317(+)
MRAFTLTLTHTKQNELCACVILIYNIYAACVFSINRQTQQRHRVALTQVCNTNKEVLYGGISCVLSDKKHKEKVGCSCELIKTR